jgi:hypothetical protein
MLRENAFHALAIADAADGEGGIQSMTPAANDDAGKNLDAFLITFNDLGMDAHAVAHGKNGRFLPILFRFNFV